MIEAGSSRSSSISLREQVVRVFLGVDEGYAGVVLGGKDAGDNAAAWS